MGKIFELHFDIGPLRYESLDWWLVVESPCSFVTRVPWLQSVGSGLSPELLDLECLEQIDSERFHWVEVGRIFAESASVGKKGLTRELIDDILEMTTRMIWIPMTNIYSSMHKFLAKDTSTCLLLLTIEEVGWPVVNDHQEDDLSRIPRWHSGDYNKNSETKKQD